MAKKEKVKYYYEGPIYQFGRRVKDYVFMETFAVSDKQAVNQFLFQAAKEIGYDRSKGANVDIDREQVWTEYEPDGINWSKYPQGLCPKCHRYLNDSGECPFCDLGDEDA